MDCTELSDLEEGEILEYDSVPPPDTGMGHFGMRNLPPEHLGKGDKEQFGLMQGKNLYPSWLTDGHPHQALKERLKPNERLRDNSLTIGTIDLESISSDGEYRSDEENKHISHESKYFVYNNAENKAKGTLYGTVEDIMSEIGETICRKSRCNYKKRKSRDLKQNLDKCSATSYDLWRREIFFCRLKGKRRKRKGSFSDSNSDVPKDRIEKRKRKKKKREIRYEEEETDAKKTKVRDFDEMRRNLLEKLKKQKAEEDSKASNESPIESSEIQEVDMVIDCTNYVDEVRITEKEGSAEEREEVKEEDEADLVKLRLIALASNKKRKTEEVAQEAEKSDGVTGGENSLNRKDVDLDRNELLLRAEALKSALLKKHQKRLNRLKVKKTCEIVSESTAVSSAEANLSNSNGKEETVDEESQKSVGMETEGVMDNHTSCQEGDEKETKETVQLSQANSKKTLPRARCKRKKNKSIGSFGSDLKENSEKAETLEEDDRTLRSQLLSDLMKKKSLKDSGKKTVLLDSAQTLANKPDGKVANEPPRTEPAKPAPVPAKKTAPKAAKPVLKIPKPEIQRIIVHLGSEDSSDEEEAPPAPEGSKPKVAEETESGESNVKKFSDVGKEAEKMVRADYERSVELLLSQARKKIEGEKQTAKGSLATPEAVYKHLPPSQRLEYIRLKQKIAERERLKMKIREGRKETSETAKPSVSEKPKSESCPKADPTPPKDTSRLNGGATGPKTKEPNPPRVPVNKTKNNLVGFCGKGLKKSVAPPANGLKSAVPVQRSTLLLPSSQALISKLKLLLKKIKVEKMIEENYGKEIAKLRTQLSLFERKQSEQRFKIKKLGEESMKTYKAIQGITAKANDKATRKESERESRGPKEEENKPEEKMKEEEEGKNVTDEPVIEITKDQGKTDKEPKNEEKSEPTASHPRLLEYNSPLQMITKAEDSTKRVDPNVMICQFDLMGVCKDEECTYQHLRTS